jgi:hypothetical protein
VAVATVNPGPGWACPSCGQAADAGVRFCPQCGEEKLAGRGPGRPWARWWRSLRLLVGHPGALTVAFRDGVRQPYVRPLALFLGINVVFFLAQSLSGFSVLSIPLRAHLNSQSYSDFANRVVEQQLQRTGVERQRFSDRFDMQQQTLAKASVLAMGPLLALGFGVLFWRRHAAPATHMVFALHFMAFMLLFLTLLFPAMALAQRGLEAAGVAVGKGTFADLATYAEATAIAGWVGLAARRVHGCRVWWCLAVAAVAPPLMLGVLRLHRVAVFWVTAWTV